MSAVVMEAIDFNFAFGTTSLALGSATRAGHAAAYKWSGENTIGSTAFTMPQNGFGEVAGIEIYAGIHDGLREHLDYAKIYIGGLAYDNQMFNEMVAPGLLPGVPDALGAAGLRHGAMATNLGIPMLMGGNPMDACPKIGPGKTLEVEVACPAAAEGGVALEKDMTVRVWIAKVLGVEKVKEVLKFQSDYHQLGYYNGQTMNCSFDLGDIEKSETMPLRSQMTNNPIKNLIPENGQFDPLEHWGKLPGGFDQDRPKAHILSVFSKQMADTTPNEWYQFVMDSNRVNDSWAQLSWNPDKRSAIKITHAAFKNPGVGTIKSLRFYRSGREIDQTYDVQWGKNPFPMPALRSPAAIMYAGPLRLPQAYLLWNEQGYIAMKDDGTASDAWSALNRDGAGVYVRGIEYELGGE